MEQKKASIYRIKTESKLGGSADVYVDNELKGHFEGEHSIEEAARFIDKLREERNRT